jgi:hypothetical protein
MTNKNSLCTPFDVVPAPELMYHPVGTRRWLVIAASHILTTAQQQLLNSLPLAPRSDDLLDHFQDELSLSP